LKPDCREIRKTPSAGCRPETSLFKLQVLMK
jgi:hypothetical protein